MSELSALESPQQQAKHILVIDDNVALRFTLALWLRSLNYHVFEAASADEAKVLLESSLPVDLIVSDVQMPGTMNGFDLRRYVMRIAPGLPIIMVSGDESHPQLQQEPILFFKKPYDLEVLATHVKKLLFPDDQPKG